MKRLFSILIILSLTPAIFALVPLEKKESEVEVLLRFVTEVSNEQNIEKLSRTLTDDIEIKTCTADGRLISSENLRREDFLEQIDSFWAGIEHYSYSNILISSEEFGDGYIIVIAITETYTHAGEQIQNQFIQRVGVVSIDGTLKASRFEINPKLPTNR